MKTDFRRDAKVLFYDLEVAPRLGYYYGAYDVTPIKEVRPPILLSVAWKWLGENKTHCLTLFDRETVDPYNDKLLVNELWNLLDECQIAVGHNSKRFDDKMANYFFIKHEMTPPSPFKEFDTLQTAKKYFKFDCNKLDYLGKLLVGEGKTETTYGDVWEDLLEGNKREKKQASDLMKKYNIRDVEVLEKIYLKMLPWATNHPNMALYAEQEHICPRCGNDSEFQVKSYRRTGVQINAIQYQCKKCGGYVTRVLTKEEREELKENGKLKSIFRNVI